MSNSSIKILELASYIEDNLESDISLKSLSGAFNLSIFQLHRVFSHLSPLPLMKYIKKRRLAHSLILLKQTTFKNIDIALQLGFNYEQSFIRAFKEEFNITPHQYRKSQKLLNITPAMKSSDIGLLKSGMMLPLSHLFLHKMDFIGKRHRITGKDDKYHQQPNLKGTEFVTKDSLLLKGEIDDNVYYSRIKNVDFINEIYDYTPSYTYQNLEETPPGFESYTLEPGEYIHFKYIGNHSPYEIDMDSLSGIYNYISSNHWEYIEKNCDLQYTLERIDKDICSPTYCELDYLYRLKTVN